MLWVFGSMEKRCTDAEVKIEELTKASWLIWLIAELKLGHEIDGGITGDEAIVTLEKMIDAARGLKRKCNS